MGLIIHTIGVFGEAHFFCQFITLDGAEVARLAHTQEVVGSNPTPATKIMAKLNEKQLRFVDEYIIDLNATQAAIRAGYSKKTARSQAQRLLTNVDIQGAIAKAVEARSKRTEITQDRVLKELATLGFSDMANYVTFQGDGSVVFDWSELPEEATRAISEITVDEFMDGKGDDARPVRRTKFKLYNKQPALTDLGKHLGMFVETKEVKGKVEHAHTGQITHEVVGLQETMDLLEEIANTGDSTTLPESGEG